MLNATKCKRYRESRDKVMAAAFLLDDLPDDPNTWTAQQRTDAKAAILTLGAPESFLRRMARSDDL